MHRSTFFILLGILVSLVSFIGLPYSWLMVLLPVFGLLIAGLGYSLRLKKSSTEPHETHHAV
jgi:CDP-diglyceride synthetase